jgi:hypothetical protein
VAVLQTVARARVAGVERFSCHPRLALVAGLDPGRRAVHLWECEAGRLREAGTVDADPSSFLAWHPTEPLLLVAGADTVTRWTPEGVSELDGVVAYGNLTFSPDGGTLWAAPSASGESNAWESSDVIDLASMAVEFGAGPRWDTGVAVHPGGGLVTTFCSDQGGTIGIFARVEQGRMRVLDRALMLDCDGYETPVFSADGRHLAVRGNAYDNSVEVFAFPSLERVLATTLGEPSPGYPYPQEWLDEMHAWSRQNLAFGPHPGVLWIGTPAGKLLAVDVETQDATEHDVLAGSPVTALAATATGDLVVAGGGEMLLLSVGRAAPVGDTPAAVVTEFLGSTADLPDGADLWTHLVMTDGSQTWEPSDRETATTAAPTDPSWLQIQAAMNAARGSGPG